MKIQDIMTKDPSCVTADATVREAAQVMKREDVGVVPVVDGQSEKRLVGIVTDRDIVLRACVSPRPLGEQTAVQVMTTDVEAAWADDSLVRVVERMARRGVRRLPVLDRQQRRGQKLVGVVSFEEVATHALDDPELAEALERLSHRRRTHAVSSQLVQRSWFLPALWRRLRG